VEFRLLGRLEVVDDGRVVPVERQRARAVLAFLLLHANEPVSADRLIDEVWGPEPPKSAAASLQNYVSHLRKALGRDVLTTEPSGYLLRVDPERFDLARFERLVADARRIAEPRERADKLRAALALWRGPALDDLAFESFAQPAIRRLEEQRLEAIEERIDADLACGRSAELVGELEGLIEHHPLRERLRGQLMRALYAAGRQADALAAYRDTRRTLREELGLDPSDELRELEQAILRHDPALGAVATTEAEPRLDSRRTVSVLFCDLVESTRLARALDPEAYRALMTRYLEAVRVPIERHGGTVEKFIGDAVMAVFGAPELHEDDALRAVRAAVEARDAVAELAEVAAAEWDVSLAVRIAVNSGEVVVVSTGGDLTVTGATVSVASHLEEEAADGAIVLGDDTHRLLRHAVRAEPVDLGDGLHGWRLDELIADAQPLARRDDAPLVGRAKQLRRLLAAFDAAREGRRCRVVTVVGEAGIGKTRLVRELAASVREEARVLVGRCVSYGEGATYLPLAEIVRQAAPEPTAAGLAALLAGEEDGEQVAERVAELTGLAEGPAAPGEAFWAVRRFVEALARERPVLLALDDVHWAEPTLLDLVEYLGEWAEGPILVLCLARRDLLETRPNWGGPTSTGFLIELDPLPAGDAAELVAQLVDEPVPLELQERIAERSGGNPLFAQQLVALAQEAPELPIETAPPSVEALIGSRLDRLDPRELEVIRRASVVGRRFSYAELEDLSPGGPPEPQLRELERRRLVHRTDDGDLYRFHHVLVRDVAYRGIPKAERAMLHERAGASLDRRDGADELVGYHFEQAYRYCIDLAQPDEHSRELAEVAATHLGDAGIRAWARADAPAAVNLLSRAVKLAPGADELACELGCALRVRGDLVGARKVLAEVLDSSTRTGNTRVELRARLELGFLRSVSEPDSAAQLLEIAENAIPILESFGDDRALGRAWLAVGHIRGGFFCQCAAWEDAAARAVHHYRRAGWAISTAVGNLAAALFLGPRPAEEGIARCQELLAEIRGDRGSEANIQLYMAGLEGMQMRFDEGRARVRRAMSLWQGLGQTTAEAACWEMLGTIEMLAGLPHEAEPALRKSCEPCVEYQETALLATRAPELANALYELERYDEAEIWTQVARDAAGTNDLDAAIAWRPVHAKILAQRGAFEEAERLADEGVDLVSRTDSPSRHADALVALAEVRRLADRNDEAFAATEHALRLYQLKGNIASAERARSRLVRPKARSSTKSP
jgi:DNA-binding SARP family transcriptional activator